ncbi:hypothetical protein [Alishewanella longhuensis]
MLLVTHALNEHQQQFLRAQGLRIHDQHFAPNNLTEALLNLLYGQFMAEQNTGQTLQQAPGWLSQLPEERFSVVNRNEALSERLRWMATVFTQSPYAIVFDESPELRWEDYQQ